MSNATSGEIVRSQTSTSESVAAATVGLAAVLFVLGIAALFEVVSLTDPVAGVPVTVLLGGLLVLMGLAVAGFGMASRLDVVQTNPRDTAGLLASTVFGGVWFVVGGLVAAQTLGLGTLGWLLVATLTGGVAFATGAFTREDVGATAPAGALAVLAGLVLLTGLIGPEWSWAMDDMNATLTATFVVPTVVMCCALFVGWAGAKAYGGFGARGSHVGAHVLMYLNVGAIIAALFGLLSFALLKGSPVLFGEIDVGLGVGPTTTIALFGFSYDVVWPVSWPFLMNGIALMNDVNGVFPAIVGTVWLVVGAVTVAVPLGVGAAIFLSEYAEEGRFTEAVEIATNGLWSTPSIVYGLFGYAFLVPRFGGSKSLLAGMLTLSFMLLPLVLITSREAMLAVPDEYRDASAALGVTKWQTVRSVVLPAAMPGVVTGVILGVGRIAGETAPILLTMAGAPELPANAAANVIGGFELSTAPPFVTNPELMQATSALPYQIFAIVKAGLGTEQFGWGAVLTLLIVVLLFYAVGIGTRYYFRKKLHQ